MRLAARHEKMAIDKKAGCRQGGKLATDSPQHFPPAVGERERDHARRNGVIFARPLREKPINPGL